MESDPIYLHGVILNSDQLRRIILSMSSVPLKEEMLSGDLRRGFASPASRGLVLRKRKQSDTRILSIFVIFHHPSNLYFTRVC